MEWEKAGGNAPTGKARGRRKGCLVVVAVVVLLVVVSRFMSCGSDKPERIDWPSSGLAKMLPEPSNPRGSIIINSDTELSISLEDMSDGDRTTYIDACKEKGFTTDAVNETSSYTAYNKDGYKLDLTFIGEGNLNIRLDAPIEMAQLSWPTSGPGAQLPAPTSLTGKVDTDSASMYAVYVGEMDKDAFTAYANQCRQAGFDVDYQMLDALFSAKNAAGYEARISYEGNKTVRIQVRAPEGGAVQDQGASSATPEPDANASSGFTTDSVAFRQTVDAYESFMNEYVDFMVKYQSSGDVVGMAKDYATMTARYADMSEQMDSIDENSLSAEDAAYLLDAQNRVNARLLELS